VRRIGGALASGAEVAGWHAWMDMQTGSFAGTGLRDDSGPDGTDPAVVDVADSTQLWSWFVYRRLSEILGGGRLRYGHLLLPEAKDRGQLSALLEAGGPASRLVVFEYFLTGPPRRAYLVLVDPSAGLLASGRRVAVHYGLRHGSAGTVVEIPLRPAQAPRSWSDVKTHPSALPYQEAPFPLTIRKSVPRVEVLDATDWPLLLVSRERLRFHVGLS